MNSPLHAVLSPARDATRRRSTLLDRLSDWLIANGRAGAHDFDARSSPTLDAI